MRHSRLALGLLLVVLGLAGNYFRYPVFFSIDFLFGSIFALLALQWLGLGAGVVAALAISSVTYVLWNHPYAVVILTLEVLAVGLLTRRWRIGLVLADALYWCGLGIPLVFAFYQGVMHLATTTVTITLLKQALNGLFNAAVARCLFLLIPVRGSRPRVPLREVTVTLAVLAVLVSSLGLVAIEGRHEVAETEQSVRTALVLARERVASSLESWLQLHLGVVEHLADMARTHRPAEMSGVLERMRATGSYAFLRLGLMDRQGISVAYAPARDELGQPTVGVNFGDRPYLPELRQTLRPLFSELLPGRVGVSRPVVVMVAPVVSGGEYDGFVGGILDLARVRQIIDRNVRSQALPGLEPVLLDRSGHVVLGSRATHITGQPLDRGPGTLTMLDEHVSQWLPLARRNISVSTRWQHAVYVTSRPIGNPAAWTLVLEQPIRPFQQAMYGQYAGRLALVFGLVLVALGIATVLTRQIIGPLEQLRILSAELPARVSSEAPVTWPQSAVAETAELTENLREMAGTLTRQWAALEQANQDLEARVAERTRELQRSEDLYRLLAENVSDVIWILDLETLRFRYVSPSVERIRGYTASETLAQHAWDTMTPRSLAHVRLRVQERLRDARPGRLGPFVDEVEHTCKDGSTVWTEDTTHYVTSPASGHWEAYGVSRDVTERKRAQEELSRSRALLRAIIDGTSDAVYVKDLEGRYLLFNAAAEWFTGRRAADVMGRDDTFLFPPDEAATVMAGDRGVIASGRTSTYEEVVTTASGEVTTFLSTKGLVLDHDRRPIGLFGIARDITDRKRAEERRLDLERQVLHAQRLESLGVLAGGIAHDFNNLLTVFLGNADFAQTLVPPGSPLEPLLRAAVSSARRARELSYRLLTFAEGGVPVRHATDIRAVIREATGQALDGSGVTVSYRLPGNIPSLHVDPGYMHQLFRHLAANAREAMPAGGRLWVAADQVRLTGETGLELAAGDYVRITVQDEGPGIPAEIVGRVFDPYFTTKGLGRHKGQGLGLTICRSIVQRHGGAIVAEQAPDAGALFTVYLPVDAEEPTTRPAR